MRTTAGVVPKGRALSYYDWDSAMSSAGVSVLIPLRDSKLRGPRNEHNRPVLILANVDGSVAIHLDKSGVGSVDLERILASARDFDLDAERSEPELAPFAEGTLLSECRAVRLARRLLTILY